MEKKIYKSERFVGERALFSTHGAIIEDCIFEDGESPLKESRELSLNKCSFAWKYPLWYCKDVTVNNSTLHATARSGIWYTHNIVMEDCLIDAPKTFRRSSGIKLRRSRIPYAEETMWGCSDINLEDVYVRGDYFAMNCKNILATGLEIDGNYAFDGSKNIEIRGGRLISKDAFWNCENVTVYDALIVGEYLGWNSNNVTFINCTIESNQGMCYMDGVTLKNCILSNTDLAFEYSTVDADIRSSVDSIKNPRAGSISVESVGEIILEADRVDVSKTKITVKEK